MNDNYRQINVDQNKKKQLHRTKLYLYLIFCFVSKKNSAIEYLVSFPNFAFSRIYVVLYYSVQTNDQI